MFKLIFSEYDAYKVFKVIYMTPILLDFCLKSRQDKKLCYKTMVSFTGWSNFWGNPVESQTVELVIAQLVL